MTIQDWYTTTIDVLKDAGQRILDFIPNIVGAIVIVAVGLIIAYIVRWAIATILEMARVQKVFEQIRFTDILKKAGMQVNIANISAEFVKWLIVIIFLVPAAKILSLDRVSIFIDSLLRYIPNVVVALIIILVGVLITNSLAKVVYASAAGIGVHTAGILSALTRYILYIFIAISVMFEVGVASYMINVLFTGLVAALAIATGLAFGLGGQNAASDLIKKLREEFRK